MQKLLAFFFSKNISIYAIFNDQSFNDTLTNDIVSFEQLGPDVQWLARAFQWISVLSDVGNRDADVYARFFFYINGVWCWPLLSQLSREKTNYIIKQLLTIEVLDMMLKST